MIITTTYLYHNSLLFVKELRPNKSLPSAVPGSSSSQPKPHLFVCAHSASAIDEIIIRLKDLKLISNERSRSGTPPSLTFYYLFSTSFIAIFIATILP